MAEFKNAWNAFLIQNFGLSYFINVFWFNSLCGILFILMSFFVVSYSINMDNAALKQADNGLVRY